MLYDNETPAAEMENHGTRPEIRRAVETGVGEDSRLSETLETQTYYYALRLANGDILRIAATADSAFGALAGASPWIVLVVLLALLVAALLASRLTHVFLAPIVSLDLHDPLKNEAYDELSPLLHRIDRQNRRISIQMDELRRRQAEFDDITARMDEGLVLFSSSGDILFANNVIHQLFPQDKAAGNYLTLCRDAAYVEAVEQALRGGSAHTRMEKNGRIWSLAASSVAEDGAGHAAVLLIVDITEREQAEQQRQEFTANVSHELKTPLTSIMGYARDHRGRYRKADRRRSLRREDPHRSAAPALAHRGHHPSLAARRRRRRDPVRADRASAALLHGPQPSAKQGRPSGSEDRMRGRKRDRFRSAQNTRADGVQPCGQRPRV